MQISVSFDLSKGKKALMKELSTFFDSWEKENDDHIDVASLKEGKKKPSKTVSDDEDEDFGTKSLREEDLEEEAEDDEEDEGVGKSRTVRGKKAKSRASDQEDAADEPEEDNEDDEGDSEDDEPSVTFQEVRAALNKYGEKHPDQAQAILLSFGIKSPKELSAVKNEEHWEGIYRKVMAKIKSSKKRK